MIAAALLVSAYLASRASEGRTLEPDDWFQTPAEEQGSCPVRESLVAHEGPVTLICDAKSSGRLTNCSVAADVDPHLAELALCAAKSMRARPGIRGPVRLTIKLKLGEP